MQCRKAAKKWYESKTITPLFGPSATCFYSVFVQSTCLLRNKTFFSLCLLIFHVISIVWIVCWAREANADATLKWQTFQIKIQTSQTKQNKTKDTNFNTIAEQKTDRLVRQVDSCHKKKANDSYDSSCIKHDDIVLKWFWNLFDYFVCGRTRHHRIYICFSMTFFTCKQHVMSKSRKQNRWKYKRKQKKNTCYYFHFYLLIMFSITFDNLDQKRSSPNKIERSRETQSTRARAR